METEQKHCRLPGCSKIVPPERHGNSWHCCDDHSYQAKKLRSSNTYHNNTAPKKAIKKNEKILDRFFLFVELDIDFDYDDLAAKGFDFGLSEGETAGPGDIVGKILGQYAYNVDHQTQHIMLWKLSDDQ